LAHLTYPCYSVRSDGAHRQWTWNFRTPAIVRSKRSAGSTAAIHFRRRSLQFKPGHRLLSAGARLLVVQGAIVTVSLPPMTRCPPRRKYKPGSHPPRQRRAPRARLKKAKTAKLATFGEGHGVAPRNIPSVNTRPNATTWLKRRLRWGTCLSGRNGGVPRAIGFGKLNFFEQPGGTSS
jgi:hypothetical protein